jgi:5-methylcytosine-specific restriction enzyme A
MTRRRSLPQHLRVQVLARDRYRCLMCGRDQNEVALEVDHVVPVADGGTDELTNLATLCRPCNNGKSAFKFTDYRSIRLMPDGVTADFAYFEDDPVGDYRRFHLYLYFKNGIHGGSTDGKFHHTWTISGTQFASSSNPEALNERRRAEEVVLFEGEIQQSLASERKRLVKNEEGICKIDG